MEDDPYDQLASLLWLMHPCDVAALAQFADHLVNLRIVDEFGADRLQ